MDNLTLAIKLSDKLGWGDMLSQIALPAIQEIIYISGESAEELLKIDDSDVIFAFLAGLDAEQSDIISLLMVRGEIEDYMRKGMSHTEAMNEWWK